MVPRVEEIPDHQPLAPPLLPRPPPSSKGSVVSSPTSSFEADDEDSISHRSNMESDQDDTAHPRAPRYPGEDTRLTSEKELFGWYSYGWAAEVFVICGVGRRASILLAGGMS